MTELSNPGTTERPGEESASSAVRSEPGEGDPDVQITDENLNPPKVKKETGLNSSILLILHIAGNIDAQHPCFCR